MHLAAGVVDVLDFGEVVALARGEVVDAVGGRGVDGPGAGVDHDVVSSDAKNLPFQERMLECDSIKFGTLESRQIR